MKLPKGAIATLLSEMSIQSRYVVLRILPIMNCTDLVRICSYLEETSFSKWAEEGESSQSWSLRCAAVP